MTRPEQPKPYPGDLLRPLPGTVPYRREYRDLLGRALRGTVTISGGGRLEHDDTVIPPVPVDVKIDGVLAVDLPPGEYVLAANLRTAEGVKVADRETVTVA